MCPAAIWQSGQEGSPIAVGMATTTRRLDLVVIIFSRLLYISYIFRNVIPVAYLECYTSSISRMLYL